MSREVFNKHCDRRIKQALGHYYKVAVKLDGPEFLKQNAATNLVYHLLFRYGGQILNRSLKGSTDWQKEALGMCSHDECFEDLVPETAYCKKHLKELEEIDRQIKEAAEHDSEHDREFEEDFFEEDLKSVVRRIPEFKEVFDEVLAKEDQQMIDAIMKPDVQS
jgi:hypothetical protein